MNTIQKILFPVDLTEDIEKLVPYVMTMVEKFDAQLHLLFVAHAFQYVADMYVPSRSIQSFENEVVEGAHKKMDELVYTHFSKLPNVYREVLQGSPSDTILKYISDIKIDLVVMGTHGRKGLGRVIFGSVAERVIKWSHIPILVINPSEPK